MGELGEKKASFQMRFFPSDYFRGSLALRVSTKNSMMRVLGIVENKEGRLVP